MFRRFRLFAVLGCCVAALAACGDDGPKRLAPGQVKLIDPDRAPEIYVVDGTGDPGSTSGGGSGGGSGGSSSGSKKPRTPVLGATDYDVVADPNLRLEIAETTGNYTRGESIPVRVRIVHIGKHPVRMVEPERDLLETLEIHVLEDGGATVRRPLVPKAAGPRKRVVTVEPGDRATIELDLYPLIGGTAAYLGGRVTLRAVFRGSGQQHAAQAQEIWNADGQQRLVSYEISLVEETPEWMEAAGIDDSASAQIVNLLRPWKLRGGGTKKPTEEIRALGEPGAYGLVHVLPWLDSDDEDRAQIGGKALVVARELGAPVLDVLRKIETKRHAAHDLAQALLEADQKVRLKTSLGVVADAVRNVGGGQDTGTSLSIMVPERGRRPAVSYQVDARGVLTVIEDPGGAAKRYSAQLPVEHLVHLKQSLHEARAWTWKPVRRRLLGDREGHVIVMFRAPDLPPIQHQFARLEALRDNPLLYECLEAITATADSLAGLSTDETSVSAGQPPR